MFTSRLVWAAAAVAVITGASVSVSTPVHAVGTKSADCALHEQLIGTSTVSGSNVTSSPPDNWCGEATIVVGYNVSGGAAQYTVIKKARGSVVVGNPGYKVFGGTHTVTNPAVIYSGRVTT